MKNPFTKFISGAVNRTRVRPQPTMQIADNALDTLIGDSVSGFIEAMKEDKIDFFSAFDVTEDLRGLDPSLKHYEVKSRVHNVISEEFNELSAVPNGEFVEYRLT